MTKSQQALSIRSGYILVERPPDYEVILSDQSAMLMELSAVCEEAGIRNVLVVGPRTKVKLSTMDVFSLGEQVAQLGLSIAVVELHDAADQDVNVLENVAANRGGSIEFSTANRMPKTGWESNDPRAVAPRFISCNRESRATLRRTA